MNTSPPSASKPIPGKLSTDLIRNFVFGVEDSLVSTVGMVSGIAAAGASKSILILTGVVLVFVEAFSMAAGSLLSDNSAREYSEQGIVPMNRSFGSTIVMFISYFLSGFVILAPYMFLETYQAFPTSIILALISLFALGYYVGRASGISPTKRGFTIALIGGAAILLGVIVGVTVEMYLLR